MKLHLSNLDELVQKVRNTHSQNYLNEAIVTYRIGAYRASLITTWIAVCVDIIEKVRELSLSGDAVAVQIEQRLDAINPNDPNAMLAFEKDILDLACDELQLITNIEKGHLEKLKNDRNVCAHPTFSQDGSQFSPHAELSLSYIVQAANYLLIHPPVKGRVVIDRIFDLINEQSFPEDEEKAYTLLSSDNNLGRVRESSVRNLTVILLKRIFKDESSIVRDLLNRMSAALSAIDRMHHDIYTNVIETKLEVMLSEATDVQLKRVFPFLVAKNDVWSKIGEAERIRIDGVLDTMDVEELIKYSLVGLAEKNTDITGKLADIVEALSPSDKSKLLSSSPTTVFKGQSIELFSGSLTFDSAEYRGNKIILPICGSFDAKDLNGVLTGSIENTGSFGSNQILNAGAIGEFFARLYSKTKNCNLDHRNIWSQFWTDITAKDFTYSSLKEQMIEDGLLEEDQAPEDDPLPF